MGNCGSRKHGGLPIILIVIAGMGNSGVIRLVLYAILAVIGVIPGDFLFLRFGHTVPAFIKFLLFVFILSQSLIQVTFLILFFRLGLAVGG